MWNKIKAVLTPYLFLAFVGVAMLIVAGAEGYHVFQGAPRWPDSYLFSVKAITTSGVPDKLKPGVEEALIGLLPVAVIMWGTMLDALITRFRGSA